MRRLRIYELRRIRGQMLREKLLDVLRDSPDGVTAYAAGVAVGVTSAAARQHLETLVRGGVAVCHRGVRGCVPGSATLFPTGGDRRLSSYYHIDHAPDTQHTSCPTGYAEGYSKSSVDEIAFWELMI